MDEIWPSWVPCGLSPSGSRSWGAHTWTHAARSLTVAIPSFNRRAQVVELVQGLGPQLRSAEGDVRVMVGLDGSTDGSREALEGAGIGVPLEIIDLPHHGAARCRNALLDRCETELIWFLDDDMIPAPRLLAAHRDAHESGDRKVVIGPCEYLLGPPTRSASCVSTGAR